MPGAAAGEAEGAEAAAEAGGRGRGSSSPTPPTTRRRTAERPTTRAPATPGRPSGQLDVCVLDAPPPAGSRHAGRARLRVALAKGMPLTRLFRVYNGTAADVVFDVATVASAQFAGRRSLSPIRATVTTCAPRKRCRDPRAGTSLYFEVSYTTGSVPGGTPRTRFT